MGMLGVLVLSAYLMSLSASSGAVAWLGWFSFLPLLAAARSTDLRRATVSGAIWGSSLYLFSAFGSHATVSAGIGSLALLTIIPTAFTVAGVFVTRRIGFSPFVLGVAWMLAELALNPLRMGHGLLATTQGDGWLLQSVGGLFGYVIVAFIVAYVSGLLLAAICVIPTWRPQFLVAAFHIGLEFWRSDIVSTISSRVRECEGHPRAPPYQPAF